MKSTMKSKTKWTPYKTGKGEWQLSYTLNGRQKTVYLGKKQDEATSRRIANIVGELLALKHRGEDIPPGLRERIASIPERVRRSLERHGLHQVRRVTLEELCTERIASGVDWKKSTIGTTVSRSRLLCEYFGRSRLIDSVTETDARAFHAWLCDRYAKSAVPRLMRFCRTFFGYAVDRGWLLRNPIPGVARGEEHDEVKEFFVTRETLATILPYMRNDKERLMLTLARCAGLRIPCEIELMTYGDFRDHYFIVHEDTKTGQRLVPYLHEIRAIMDRLRVGKRDDEKIFDSKGCASWCRFAVLRSAHLAGLTESARMSPWPKLFVNCRSSCITEYENLGYDSKTLDRMFGNSSQVRYKHYRQFRRDEATERILRDSVLLSENRIGAGFDCRTTLVKTLVNENYPDNLGVLEPGHRQDLLF